MRAVGREYSVVSSREVPALRGGGHTRGAWPACAQEDLSGRASATVRAPATAGSVRKDGHHYPQFPLSSLLVWTAPHPACFVGPIWADSPDELEGTGALAPCI